MEPAAALKKLEDALAEHYGWGSHPTLREKVNIAIATKANRLGIAPQEYCRIAAGSQSELLALVEEAATCESFFFREPDQFDRLRTKILPELIENHAGEEKLRLWSAACSTGEEAYSLAIVFDLAETGFPSRAPKQAEVFATDVRNGALLEASQARYRGRSLRDLDKQILEKYFERSEESYTVVNSVRRVVTFRRVNLLDKLFWKGIAGKFDLIICANQLLYLHNTAARQMVVNLVNSLSDGGYLMVAPSEINLVSSSRLVQIIDSPSLFRRII